MARPFPIPNPPDSLLSLSCPIEVKGARMSVETSIPAHLDFLWLELTSKCNLECTHCYVSSSPTLPLEGRLQEDDWKQVLTEARTLGCQKIQFIGGEPTLHPALPDLLHHARVTGFEFIEVFTNGTTFTPALKRALVSNRTRLAFSVYASEGDVHDEVTQREGSFQRTWESIRWSLDVGLPLRVSLIVMESNEDQIDTTLEALAELGVNSVGIDRVRGVGRGQDHVPENDIFKELCGRCHDGRLCVTTDGAVYPCVMARSVELGSFERERGLRSILESSRLRAFRSEAKNRWDAFAKGADCRPVSCGPNETCSPMNCQPGF